MKRRAIHLAFGMCVVGLTWGALQAEPEKLPPEAAALVSAGARFDHGYTRNPIEFLHLDENWSGGDETLSHLKQLDATHGLMLSKARLSKTAFEAIAAMPRLKSLWILGVPVSDEDWRHIQSIDSLEYLSLSSMPAQAAVRLRGMKHLKTISIENNEAQTTLELADLPELRALRIHNIGPQRGNRPALACECTGMPQLGELLLSELTVSGLHLSDFKSLDNLTLWLVQWEDPRDASLAGLTKLERVRFQDPATSDDTIRALRDNPALASVEIHSDRLQDADLDALAGLTALNELRLSSQALTGAAAARVKELPGLQTLWIDYGTPRNKGQFRWDRPAAGDAPGGEQKRP